MADEETEVQDEQEPDEAAEQADFEAGFSGEYQEEAADEAAPDEEAEEPVEEEDAVEEPVEPDPWAAHEQSILKKVQARYDSQLRNLAGHIGGLKGEIQSFHAAKSAVESQGVETPSNSEISSAAVSSEKMDALKEDYPEWAEAVQQFTFAALKEHQGGGMDASVVEQLTEQLESTKAQMEELKAQAVEERRARQYDRLDTYYDNWQADIQSEKFGSWLAKQPADAQQLVYSENATDAKKLLDAFYASTEDLPASSRQSNRRLQNAVPPTEGRSAPRRSYKTEHDEFLEGFNSP